jgi:putative peptidoglycan lipid II flippase
MFLVIPSAFIALILRGYIVRILFGFGDQATADTLGWLAGSIIAQSMFFMVARFFYALEDTKTPLFVSLGAIALNVAISIPLSKIYGVSGLGLALSIASFIELIILLSLLKYKMGDYGLKSIVKSAIKITLASTAMGLVLYCMVRYLFPLYKADIGFLELVPEFVLMGLIGLTVYFLASKTLRVHEVKIVVRIAKRNIFKVLHRG